MIINRKLIDDMSLIIENQKWPMLKTFFSPLSLNDKEDTEIVTSVFRDENGTIVKNVIDTKVPRELVDKVLLWGQCFMPDYLRQASPEFHRSLIALHLSEDNQYFAAPRGFSKTTVLQLVIAYLCVYKMEKYIVLIEKTFTEASEVLDGVRSVFNHPRVHQVYGNLLHSKENARVAGSVKQKDAEGDFYINGVRLKGKGFETSIRGLKSGAWRPTVIFCDDIEKDEHIGNPEQRQKYTDRYNASIQPAVDVEGRLKVQGTILHLDSLLMNLISLHKGCIYRAYYSPLDMEYDAVELPTVSVDMLDFKQAKLLWPVRWPWDTLMAKRKDMMSRGDASDAFVKEYLNNPAGDSERVFKAVWLWNKHREIELDTLLASGKVFSGYCAVDMADATTVNADYTGVVVHLVDRENNRYRVDVRREKRNILGVIDLIFEIWQQWSRWGLTEIKVEKRGFADQIKPLLEQEITRRNIFPNVVECKPLGRSKENRIKGNLQGRYEQGNIWTVGVKVGGHFKPVGDTEVLLNELYNFPAAINDDVSDAEAYVVEDAPAPSSYHDGGYAGDPTIDHDSEDPNDPFSGFAKKTDIYQAKID